MITLLKGLNCYTPAFAGKKDLLLAGGQIERIGDTIDADGLADTVLDCRGLFAFPGLIDQHVHMIGGGGEDGFGSRLPEIDFEDIVSAGVSTAVGLLGADDQTKTLDSLLAKTRALELQGITTYMYSGSYALPPVTLTGSLARDLVLIDKVVGVGEIAISDYRSSCPDDRTLLETAAQAHLGGMVSGKAGVVHFHVGDGKEGLRPLTELIRRSDLPVSMFVPTHVNRNPGLFEQGLQYNLGGGSIDLTAGETEGLPVPEAIKALADQGADLSKVTVSSDANGNMGNGKIGKCRTLYDDVVRSIVTNRFGPERVFPLVTENVAKVLHLYPHKGMLQAGSDADILITDDRYRIRKVFCRGKLAADMDGVDNMK